MKNYTGMHFFSFQVACKVLMKDMKVLRSQWHQNLRIWNAQCQLFSDLFWCLNICLCWQIIAPLCWLIRSCKIILISSSQQSPPAMSAPVFLQSGVNRILMNDSSLPSSCWQQVSTFKGRRLLTFTIFWNWKLSEQGHCVHDVNITFMINSINKMY